MTDEEQMEAAEHRLIAGFEVRVSEVGLDRFIAESTPMIQAADNDRGGAPLGWLFEAAARKRFIERASAASEQ